MAFCTYLKGSDDMKEKKLKKETKASKEVKVTKDVKVKRRRFSISPVTIVIVLILLLAFAVLNFYVFPMLYEAQKGPVVVDIPSIKKANSSFVDEQLEIRKLEVPLMTAPAKEIGKNNPFEE